MDFFDKYGIRCWYDHHELFLGDDIKSEIIEKGIETVDYSIIIINKKFLSRKWPCEEAKRLYERFKTDNNFTIFPILLDIEKEDLKNSKIDFLLEIKYQFLKGNQSIEQIGFQILNRIFHDKVSLCEFDSIDSLLFYLKNSNRNNLSNLYNGLKIVKYFDKTNYHDKCIALLSLNKILNCTYYNEITDRFAVNLANKLDANFDVYKIIESIFLINTSYNINYER